MTPEIRALAARFHEAKSAHQHAKQVEDDARVALNIIARELQQKIGEQWADSMSNLGITEKDLLSFY